MSIVEVFNLASGYLIQLMAITCLFALCVRFLAHKANKINKTYFNSFSHADQAVGRGRRKR